MGATSRLGRSVVNLGVVVLGALALSQPAHAGNFQVFDARSSYTGVLLQQGRPQLDSDWNESGAIAKGDRFGDFSFDFGPEVQLAGVQGFAGGLAIGSALNQRGLGGDQGFGLVATAAGGVSAFGVTVAYQDPSVRNYFRISIGCPTGLCSFSATPPDPLLTGSGTFFLGIVADPGSAFDAVALSALIPRNAEGQPTGTVPGWQVTSISWAPVPEPSALALLATAIAAVAGIASKRFLQSRASCARSS
jgi:hypothetical protein